MASKTKKTDDKLPPKVKDSDANLAHCRAKRDAMIANGMSPKDADARVGEIAKMLKVKAEAL